MAFSTLFMLFVAGGAIAQDRQTIQDISNTYAMEIQEIRGKIAGELPRLLAHDFLTRERAQDALRRILDCESARLHPSIIHAALSPLIETHANNLDARTRLTRLRERYAPRFLTWDAFLRIIDEELSERARTQRGMNVAEQILSASEKVLSNQRMKLRDLKKAEDFGQVIDQALMDLRARVLVSKKLTKIFNRGGHNYTLTLSENDWPNSRVLHLEHMDSVNVVQVLAEAGFRPDYTRLPTEQRLDQISWQPLNVGLGLKRELTAVHYVPYRFVDRTLAPPEESIGKSRGSRFDLIYYYLVQIFRNNNDLEGIAESIGRLQETAPLPRVLLPSQTTF